MTEQTGNITKKLKLILGAFMVCVYFALGVYLLIFGWKDMIRLYSAIFGSMLLAYSLFRAYRLFVEYREKHNEEE